MRCVDVIRELAVPTDGPASAGLAEHLAGCPRCAAWAERDAKLERLWEATRPPVPPPAAWDALWANVSAAREPFAVPTPTAAHPAALPRRWRRAALTLAAVAQAAVVLVAMLVLSRPAPQHQSLSVVATAPPPAMLQIVIDPGAS